MSGNDRKTVMIEFSKPDKFKVLSGNAIRVSHYRKARNFKELIGLIRVAEQKMTDHGVTDILDRISMLRGIYYGTPWSMDFLKEKSTTRNNGFQIFTASMMPADPRPALGQELFAALQNSAEVKDGSRSLDVGHTIIGLQARASFTSRSVPLPTGGTGLETSTWLGDIGGGAGMLAYKRISNPKMRAKTLFTNEHDYGASVNLEGDVAGYLIASETPPFTGPCDLAFKNKPSLADALTAYLDAGSDLWKNRAGYFLSMNSATFDASGAITNKDAVMKSIAGKIEIFAVPYITVRLKDNHALTSNIIFSILRHVPGIATEISKIFVEALLDNHKHKGSTIVGTSDPNPSDPAHTKADNSVIDKIFDTIDGLFKN